MTLLASLQWSSLARHPPCPLLLPPLNLPVAQRLHPFLPLNRPPPRHPLLPLLQSYPAHQPLPVHRQSHRPPHQALSRCRLPPLHLHHRLFNPRAEAVCPRCPCLHRLLDLSPDHQAAVYQPSLPYIPSPDQAHPLPLSPRNKAHPAAAYQRRPSLLSQSRPRSLAL